MASSRGCPGPGTQQSAGHDRNDDANRSRRLPLAQVDAVVRGELEARSFAGLTLEHGTGYLVHVNLPEPWNSLVGAVAFFAAIVCVKMLRGWMRGRHGA